MAGRIKMRVNRFGVGLMAAGLVMTAALSGCTEGTQEEEKRIVVEQEAPDVEYKLTTVSRRDVISTTDIRCTYSQYSGEDLAFEVSGKLVSKVYVKDGDAVTKGTLLAELSGGSREDEIERLEYQIARNQYLLGRIDEDEYYEISRRWLNKLYGKGWDETGGIEDYQANNEYRREDLRDAISLDEQELAKVKQEVRQSKLIAGLTGTVSIVKDRLEGSTSVRDEVVIRIKDNSERFFATMDMTDSEYVNADEQLDMVVVGGPGKGTYRVEPYRKENWTDRMFFTIVEGGDGVVFNTGDTGTVTIVLEEKKNVLTLPVEAVHGADERWYVYVVNAAGDRDVKWIEIGLKGGGYYEITGGLEEGEKVILK